MHGYLAKVLRRNLVICPLGSDHVNFHDKLYRKLVMGGYFETVSCVILRTSDLTFDDT